MYKSAKEFRSLYCSILIDWRNHDSRCFRSILLKMGSKTAYLLTNYKYEKEQQ